MLNPLSFHGRAKIQWQKKQALWFQSCSVSHQLFCNCGDWQTHLQRYRERQRCHFGGITDGDSEGISFVTEDGDDRGDTGGKPGGDTGDVNPTNPSTRYSLERGDYWWSQDGRY
ncbi:ORF2 [Giant panda anellovirus]|uniref:ORF2 n=1 Tax=Giant panda anellovirus TaxID=2016460 RepID=A0A220IGJ5_9VIRU|nr:ORF2 [Giant panda anellovirus]ASH99113.1 ORF2 [Giant panda anellovirus]